MKFFCLWNALCLLVLLIGMRLKDSHKRDGTAVAEREV